MQKLEKKKNRTAKKRRKYSHPEVLGF